MISGVRFRHSNGGNIFFCLESRYAVLALFALCATGGDLAAKDRKKHPPYARLHVLEGHEGIVRSVAFQPGTHTFVSGGADRSIRVWHAGSGALQAVHQLPRSG